jgi:dTDP-L-rhamnose 4-epimerase
MSKSILITGGAGFIGTRLARACLNRGLSVRLLDNFSPQVHNAKELPNDLKGAVELFEGDIRDRALVQLALAGVDSVVHLAAETGTGQSMYEIQRYFDVNVQGTAVLLDLLQNNISAASVERIVVASSRAVYGEGAYLCKEHGAVYPEQRERNKMEAAIFEPVCPFCGHDVALMPTPEIAPFKPMSYYGLTKQVQEQAVLLFGKTHGINAFGLRYQNVYGPGQSLKNPYTGILAVFSNLARQNQSIEIYEDGKESRDFVYVDDIVEATAKCIDFTDKFVGALNVGSGQATSVMTVAEEIRNYFKSNSPIGVTGKFRIGDIRHNIADISELKKLLHFTPAIAFSEGLSRFLDWATQIPAEDKEAYIRSVAELSSKGLMGSVK